MNEGETRPEGTIWLSSGSPLTEAQAAVLIVTEARKLVEVRYFFWGEGIVF